MLFGVLPSPHNLASGYHGRQWHKVHACGSSESSNAAPCLWQIPLDEAALYEFGTSVYVRIHRGPQPLGDHHHVRRRDERGL